MITKREANPPLDVLYSDYDLYLRNCDVENRSIVLKLSVSFVINPFILYIKIRL